MMTDRKLQHNAAIEAQSANDGIATITRGLNLYLLFVVSWFLHFGARLPFLGAIRFDLLLVCILSVMALLKTANDNHSSTRIDTLLKVLIGYSLLTLPFVEWPGTVVKTGLPNLVKAIVFYYFTITFVKTERDLKRFVFVFLACQLFRILEPLRLHMSYGYWGSAASMEGGGEVLQRLSGAPHDVVNPNGLAFIVCMVLPFLYFMARQSFRHWLAFVFFTPVCLYVLALTGSRTGLVGLTVVFLGIMLKSKWRLVLGFVGIFAAIFAFSFLSANMQDRYLSTVGEGEKNQSTADERIEGAKEQFRIALRKPIFGHGLGTSPEANFNFSGAGPYAGRDLPAHNLYLEIGQELGLVGLIIFLLLMKSIVSNLSQARRVNVGRDTKSFVPRLIDALQVWLWLNFVVAFASYGLSTYEWYLLGGLAVVVQRLAINITAPAQAERKTWSIGNHAGLPRIGSPDLAKRLGK